MYVKPGTYYNRLVGASGRSRSVARDFGPLAVALCSLLSVSCSQASSTALDSDSPQDAALGGARDGGNPAGRVCDVPEEFLRTEEFLQELEGCVVVRGTITVDGPVSNLESLASLRTIRGNFGMFFNVWLTDLRGLENLEEVRLFSITGGTLLTLGALQNLRRVASLNLADTLLEDLDGLQSLSVVDPGPLTIIRNSKLVSLRGLSGLTRIEGDLRIYLNPLLPSEEIDWLLGRVDVTGDVETF